MTNSSHINTIKQEIHDNSGYGYRDPQAYSYPSPPYENSYDSYNSPPSMYQNYNSPQPKMANHGSPMAPLASHSSPLSQPANHGSPMRDYGNSSFGGNMLDGSLNRNQLDNSTNHLHHQLFTGNGNGFRNQFKQSPTHLPEYQTNSQPLQLPSCEVIAKQQRDPNNPYQKVRHWIQLQPLHVSIYIGFEFKMDYCCECELLALILAG